ncbi:unnamed protein product [Echinostoma caproni]|uniref:G_PROTEIN_RECEP_F1_2 domain-containing protein n=1 Tax=Echinostoma caproni TaxID=27848 RepID=A0A183AGW4_9TREM|nr:unnamed protein product [Echinostoma caproni]
MTGTNQSSSGSTDGSNAFRPILLMLIACVGLIGNTLNLIVLRSYHTTQITHGGECTARVNLLGLALADFLVCLTSLPLGYVKRRHESFSFMLFYTIVGPGLVTYFLSVSIWMVLLMSVARYLAVCRPLTSRAWLTSRHMFRVILLIYVFGILFHIPSFLMFTYDEELDWFTARSTKCLQSNQTMTEHTKHACTQPTVLVVYERPFWRSETVDVTHHVIHILFTNIAPFIGVVISNIAVIRACRRSDQCRRMGVVVHDKSGSHRSRTSGSSPSHKFMLKANRPPNGVPREPYPLRVPGTPTTGGFWFNHTGRAISCRLPASAYTQTASTMIRYPGTATNRVTPLLLAVIVAFLLFTAPFGIVHFVCLRLMRNLGVRVRDNRQARRLYMALNLTVEWTNVVQLFSCASNFFLYFLVSTIFRRTTRRTFRRMYRYIRNAHTYCCSLLSSRCRSNDSDVWKPDSAVPALQLALNQKLSAQIVPENRLPLNPLKSEPNPVNYAQVIHLPHKFDSKILHHGTHCCGACRQAMYPGGPCTSPCPPGRTLTETALQSDEANGPCICRNMAGVKHFCCQYSRQSCSGTAFCSEPHCSCTSRCSSCLGHGSCTCPPVKSALLDEDTVPEITKVTDQSDVGESFVITDS